MSEMQKITSKAVRGMWWSYCKRWSVAWRAAVRAGRARDLVLSAVCSGIGVLYGFLKGWVTKEHFLPFMLMAVGGYIGLLLLTWVWHALFVSARIYHEEQQQISELEEKLGGETYLSRKAIAQYIRQSVDVIRTRQLLHVAQGELEPKKRELEDAYTTIESLQPFKDEVDSLRKRVEDKERELATLTPPEKQSRLRLQAQGVTHIAYDHNLSVYKHSYDGTGHGFTIVIQVINLAVRGAPAKAVRVRAQAVYRTEEQGSLLLTPLVWIDSKTSDAVIGPGEIRELVIARKDSYGFWDFLTHGPHGNVSPSDGIDFDLEIDLIDVDSERIVDVEPPLYFHWHWREGPLTPHFYPIPKPKKLAENAGA
jgi:hypothetical protein